VKFRRLLYGGPAIAISYLLFFLQFYFLKFATDVLLVSPAIVGTMLGSAKLLGAITDPLVGSFSDRSRFRLGRRRPLMLTALPFLAIGFCMVFMPPMALASSALVAWLACGLFVFYCANTLYSIPHGALGAELSTDLHERTRIFAIRQVASTLGMLVAAAAIHRAMGTSNARGAVATLALVTSFVAVALLSVTPLAVPEPPRRASKEGMSFRSNLRDVLASRPARLLIFVIFIENLGVGAVGTTAPYVAEYVLQRKDLVATLPAAYIISAVVSVPIWVRVSRRVGPRDAWFVGMLIAAVAFAGFFFVDKGDVAMVLGCMVVAGTGMGCGGILSSTILTQVIDLDTRRTGEQKEGTYAAMMALALKVGISLAIVFSGVVLSATGFTPNASQTSTSLFGIRILISILPCSGFVIGAFLFRRFSIEEPAEAASAT
jgi:Na+/melibiose symporter-like transporter